MIFSSQAAQVRPIYEDDTLLIVFKPAHMPTQSSSKGHQEDLYSVLKNQLLSRKPKESYLALHHRLDAATMGLVLFCKDKRFNKSITEMFVHKKITKKYLTIIEKNGLQLEPEWTVHNRLQEYPFKHYKKAKVSESERSREAITHFKVIAESKKRALLECTPMTGRLHQIRIHLSHGKTPIIGDFHYNPKRVKGEEFFLCAHEIFFIHPRTKKDIKVSLDLDLTLLATLL